MVAERAVQQLISDLRGELGVKFQEIETLIVANKSEAEEGISDLSAALTDAFKQNNASLRNEIKASVGDAAQELKQQLDELTNDLANQISGKS